MLRLVFQLYLIAMQYCVYHILLQESITTSFSIISYRKGVMQQVFLLFFVTNYIAYLDYHTILYA